MYVRPVCFLKTVGVAGAQERLTDNDSIKVPAVVLQAESSNTGDVYIGDNECSSTDYGIYLDAGDSVTMSAVDLGMASALISLSDIWLDVGVGGDGVSCMYLTRGD